MNNKHLKIVLAGSVISSRRTLQALLRHRANIVGVLGLALERAGKVSGYCRLDDLAANAGVPYLDFQNINDPRVVATLSMWEPDLFFVVGLSQLVKAEVLAIPRLGCVGFHPTWLPEGRGRAPLAWLVLEGRPGAATFFLMNEGVDAGPILAQEPFYVTSQDYAGDVVERIEDAIDTALDQWLPRLLSGEWKPRPQVDAVATYYGRRTPRDGLINWSRPATVIHALIRAASHPHPGAYTFVRDHKLIVWRATVAEGLSMQGVVGRVVAIDDEKGILVQTGAGHLWLGKIEFVTHDGRNKAPSLRVGTKLGYSPQDEIYELKQRLLALESRLLSESDS